MATLLTVGDVSTIGDNARGVFRHHSPLLTGMHSSF